MGYVKVRRFSTPHIHEENLVELFGKAVSLLSGFESAAAELALLLAPFVGSAEAVEADLRASRDIPTGCAGISLKRLWRTQTSP
ncbi:MAG: hypothetical protein LUE27_01215 [Clostridia bacterium]|nr:hypothetical protein [Clostridia bacterium]